jgi:RNA polymerase sigma-70 factor, ECF subfamily
MKDFNLIYIFVAPLLKRIFSSRFIIMLETIKALREGNHHAFEQLFDICYEPLCRYAYSILRDMDNAEEVVQKTFYKLWDQHETLNIQSSINSYLYRIVHNDCLNTIHQKTSHQEHNLNYLSSMNTDVNSTMEQLESSDLQKAIEIALAGLPPQCRRVFEMSRLEQLSYSEIATQLNISTNTVENHISKALKLLRIELKEFLSICLLLQLLK